MGTNNFYYNNVLYTIEEPEVEYESFYEDILEDIQFSMDENKVLKEEMESYIDNGQEAEWENGLRSYDGRIIGRAHHSEWRENKEWDGKNEEEEGEWEEIQIEMVLRGGYYSGMNLDYTIYIEEWEEWRGIDKDEIYNWDLTEKNTAFIEKITGEIEKVYKEVGTELTKTHQLCDGSAIYCETPQEKEEKEEKQERTR